MELQPIIPDARAGRQIGVVRFTRAEINKRSKIRRRLNGNAAEYDARPDVRARRNEYARKLDPTVRSERHRKWYAGRDPIKRIIYNAERGAKARGLIFAITGADLLPLPTHCPILDFELIYNTSLGRNPRKDERAAFASIDRIDNTKGYIQGNVAIISWRANQLKSDGTADEHTAIAVWMKRVAG